MSSHAINKAAEPDKGAFLARTPPDDSGHHGGPENERAGWAELGAELADLSRRVDEHFKRLEGE